MAETLSRDEMAVQSPPVPPVPPAAPSAPAGTMREYYCAQGHWVTNSDGQWGRVQVYCRKCRKKVTVYLGGYRRAGGGEGAAEGN